MSGVACATPVTPSLPSSRLGARLPVGEWLPRADGTSSQKILWCASAQLTPIAGRHKKTGCHPRKISIRGPRNIDPALRAGGVRKGLTAQFSPSKSALHECRPIESCIESSSSVDSSKLLTIVKCK